MHTWKFFRTGQIDQVSLENGADLLNLEHLDQKLWVALTCPVKGLELDEKTLAMIDTDGDGRIRVPELITAIKWAAAHLNDAGDLLKGSDTLPLTAFNTATAEGKALLASAKQIQANFGRAAAATISLADVSDTVKIFAGTKFNGDGLITAASVPDADLAQLVADIIATKGSAPDRSGAPGIDQARIDAFFADAAAFSAWSAAGAAAATSPLGAGTAAALGAVKAIRAKADDYFARCRLAAFDTRATAAVNRAEGDFSALATKDLAASLAEVAHFPLSRIEAGRALPLTDGINPAWTAAVAALHAAAVAPVFGAGKTSLTSAEWDSLNAKLAAHETWAAAKAGAAVEALGLARINAILATKDQADLTALVAQDAALAPQTAAIAHLEKLLRYARDLRALLHNFVNFADFYSRDKWAVFQAGTLYLDSRSTELCIRVDGPNALAAMSKIYIAYVDCKRPGAAPMKIAACFTQGDSDFLFVGRNALFYDRQGRDWDAVITSIADNPISIRQAFWSPYKKFLRMIEDMAAKRAAAAEAASAAKMAATAENAANAKPVEPKKIDVGAVAAMGVAFGAISGAAAAIVGGLATLAIWKLPLVLVAVMLAISLPSMILAWLKLRQRTLGPILEGNGWAINGRVKINIPFGTALTDMARKPDGSQLSLDDPYEDKEAAARKRKLVFWLLVAALVAGAAWIRWDATKHRGADGLPRYFWMERAAPTAPAEAPKA